MLENQWHYVDMPELGLMNIINTMIHELDISDPNALPDIRRGSTVLIGSDYSGQHAASDYESLAFVLADIENCHEWGLIRRLLREISLRDGRRFSHKALRDKKKKRNTTSVSQRSKSDTWTISCSPYKKNIGESFQMVASKELILRSQDIAIGTHVFWRSCFELFIF